jgi:hypothetical protein
MNELRISGLGGRREFPLIYGSVVSVIKGVVDGNSAAVVVVTVNGVEVKTVVGVGVPVMVDVGVWVGVFVIISR